MDGETGVSAGQGAGVARHWVLMAITLAGIVFPMDALGIRPAAVYFVQRHPDGCGP